MTVQKKILDLTGSQYLVQKVKSAINDVDSSLSTHIADTDIHVTTADKSKWNNGVSQSYVLRYSSTALVASSTNSNTLLDNTDNLKVGDKVIDSSGVLFSVTAIDTANSTFTIGTALVDLAQDSDVVHKSGNETVGGVKTFTNNISLKSLTAEYTVTGAGISVTYSDKNGLLLAQNKLGNYQSGISYNKFSIFAYDSNNQLIDRTLTYSSANSTLATAYFRPDNDNIVSLGTSGNRWSKIYSTEYYYGSNNVEFSTKFVTTDTSQIISERKTFSVTPYIYNADDTGYTPSLYFKSSKAIKGDTTGSNADSTRISHIDKNDKLLSYIQLRKVSNGSSDITLYCSTLNANNQDISSAITFFKSVSNQGVLRATADNDVSLGNSTYKWKDVNTYLVNGLTPSSLGMPDLNNGIDISSYITDLTGNPNAYSPPANGYIAIRSTTANVLGIVENTTGMGSYSRGTNQVLAVNLPVVKNSSITIYAVCSSLSQAKFIPCQGNV